MKIRGDLKVLRDLVVKTVANDAKIGRLLYAGSDDGTVVWNDLTVFEPDPAETYDKGSLVFDAVGSELFIARGDYAPGNDLSSPIWLNISGGGGGGPVGGGVETYAERGLFPTTGSLHTIYIAEETNSLYRWGDSGYLYISGGITEEIPASITVGGIKATEKVPEGADLEKFIAQLINPVLHPTKTSNYVTLLGITPATYEVGTVFTAALTSPYTTGTIFSKDGAPNISLTGGKIESRYSGPGVNYLTGKITTTVAPGTQFWSVTTSYTEGNPSDYYYDSVGERSYIYDSPPKGDGSREEGIVTDLSESITGKYKYFVYSGHQDTIPDVSEDIRNNNTGSGFYPTRIFRITIGKNKRGIAFYIKKEAGEQKKIRVTLFESSGADVTGTFNSEGIEIPVRDASGVSSMYLQYKTDLGGVGYTAEKHYDVTLTQ